MMRHLTALALTLMFVAPHAHAQAERGLADYRPDNEEWNGLSSLVTLAEHEGVAIRFEDDVDVSTLGDAILMIVYPEAPLDAEAAADFVWSGGTLIVADDFGESATLAEAFGLTRVEPGPQRARLQQRDALPAFSPLGAHPLTEGVSLVVANHPSALRGDGLPVLRFDDGAGLVYDMAFGEGDAVFLSDASLLTNLMLPVHDNARLVQNILRRACAERSACTLVVATHDVRLGGRVDTGGGEGGQGRALAPLEDVLERMKSVELPPGARRTMASVLFVGALLILMTVFPAQLPTWLARPPRGLEHDRPRSDFEAALKRYDGTDAGSYVLPIAMVKDTFERRFYAAVGLPRPPRGNAGARKVAADRYVTRVSPELSGRARDREVARIERTLARFADLPERGEHPTSERRVHLAAFRRTLEEAQGLLEPIGADEPADFSPPR